MSGRACLIAGEMCFTYCGEGVVQVIQSPSNDHNVVNVEPEGEHGCSKANSCTHRKQINIHLM